MTATMRAVVVDGAGDPGGEYPVGAQVAAMMGGMGRSFDGGYAEYVSVPAGIVVPFTSRLGWDVLGAVPEMLQTSAGSLRVGLQDVDGAVELVGVNVLRDTLRAVRAGGTVCFTGMLSDTWTIDEFYPMDWLPNGVRLTAYSGEAADLTSTELQAFFDAVAAGHVRVPVGRVYGLDEIVQAHGDMEAGTAGGKLVVLPR